MDSDEILIELNKNHDDEKKSTDDDIDEWAQIAKIQNADKYELAQLEDDKSYGLRARCQNQFGLGPYSSIIKFKTSFVI